MFPKQYKIMLGCLIVTFLHAGEYANAFILANNYPNSQSLGESTVSASVSSGHALNNPAGFIHSSHPHVSLVYEQFNGLSSNIGLEGQLSVGPNFSMGLTLIHSSIPELYFRSDLSQITPEERRHSVLNSANKSHNSIRYREDAIFLSLAREYEFELNLGWKYFKIPFRMPLGVSAKYIDKLLVNNRGIGSGVDFGAQLFFNLAGMSDLLLNTEFSVGFFLSDILNTPVYWSTKHQDAIKRNYTSGYSIHQTLKDYNTEIIVLIASQAMDLDRNRYGLEIKVKDLISIRGGHNGYSPSFGLGISLKKFIIAYSFSQHELAGMQKIEINYQF